MPPDFRLLNLLQRHAVPFVAVGGHAVNIHGYRRATEDTDVIWLRSESSEHALAMALAEVNAQYIANDIDPATGIERTVPVSLAFILARPLMMLWVPSYGFFDLFDYIPGSPAVDVREIFDTSLEHEGIRYASLPWLRRMKEAAGRTKDLEDLRELREIEEA